MTAASDWGAPAERKRVIPALARSYEDLLHDTGISSFLLALRGHNAALRVLRERRLERAIGVIYLPETERHSHYFYAELPQQFDAILHFDETHAVDPLECTPRWQTGEAPETFPVGV